MKTLRTTGDFPELVVEFHDRVPPELVQEAIDSVLSASRKEDEAVDGMRVSMSSAAGAASFNSIYEYRLFQLLPTLQEIDPSRAERILREHQDVKTLFGKYPNGVASLNDPGRSDHGNFMMTTSFGANSTAASEADDQSFIIEQHRYAQIIADAEKHPQDALANAASLGPEAALDAYIGIARINAKKDQTVSRIALRKAADLVEKLPLDEQTTKIRDIASISLRVGDEENAKSFLEKGIALIGKLYKADTDAGDPNTAPKAYWPSTSAWRAIIFTATKLDQRWSTTLLDGIPDEGIRALNKITIAKAILGANPTGFYVMTYSKKVSGMTWISEEN